MLCILTLNVTQRLDSAMRLTSQLKMFGEIIAVCAEVHTKHINTLCGQNVELYINIQSVPRSKQVSVSVIKTNQLMLYRDIIAV